MGGLQGGQALPQRPDRALTGRCDGACDRVGQREPGRIGACEGRAPGEVGREFLGVCGRTVLVQCRRQAGQQIRAVAADRGGDGHDDLRPGIDVTRGDALEDGRSAGRIGARRRARRRHHGCIPVERRESTEVPGGLNVGGRGAQREALRGPDAERIRATVVGEWTLHQRLQCCDTRGPSEAGERPQRVPRVKELGTPELKGLQ